MWALHDDIRIMLKDVKAKTQDSAITEKAVKALAHMINDMIYKEEHILFPMALETLSEDDWTKVRQGEDEIGYAWIKPADEWRPLGVFFQQALLTEKVGSLNLDTGQLTADQVNLVLTHLPLDISFVNENDGVVYYSQTAERVFPRSPGIIGRKVQNCHPPKSVDMVEKILQEFKSGNKDSAEFWIQMKGRFIHIRYFAARDRNGNYRGTLEVSQDVTGIKRLEGEKRLLDWD
ncbi:PAS domain-containing protein [Dissulfurispira sp.]|uniref:PAS domain-containing protein n=1 Tax=Dissulfurispira sp. TaxID=2817609 RepID=UPI002FDA9D24